MIVYNVNTFDYSIIDDLKVQRRRKGNPGRRDNSRKYLDAVCAFDIETTNDRDTEQAFMYIWQFQIEDKTIIGRTWSDFILFLERVKASLKSDIYLVVFVHNLSFEFQFLRGIYQFSKDEVFAIDSRKVLKCEMFNHFEFRCSYLQTNMSLKEFTEKMGIEDAKLSGDDYNYAIARYPWTELTDQELLYCVNDVRGLVEAMKKQMLIDQDNFYSLPITSTGYVRRDVKAAMRHFNKNELKNMLPDYEIFKMLREAFRGGNTHANRFYSGLIMNDVKSYDFASHYPNCQINDLFPMSPWIREDAIDLDRCLIKIYRHKRACLMRVKIWGIRLRDILWGCPYIPKAKCRNLKNAENDNGRILSADYLEITLTDLDFDIILKEYDFDYIEFEDFYHCRYGRLPKPMRDTISEYFERKTALKGVDGQEVFYMKAKNKLNSVYGMSVQSPVKQSIDFLDDFIERSDDESELLAKSNKRAFQSYAWGVWCTAWARHELEDVLNIVHEQTGGAGFIYCDTDSVKYLGSVDLRSYNLKKRLRSAKNGGCATDPAGVEHYLGVMEPDAEYKRFITLGAKKYAYEYKDGKIGITVAGVGKKKGAKELEKAGGLKKFKEGFTFYAAGGTESKYNDHPEIDHIIREGREIKITSNVYISDSTYTLGITEEYRRILERAEYWKLANDKINC